MKVESYIYIYPNLNEGLGCSTVTIKQPWDCLDSRSHLSSSCRTRAQCSWEPRRHGPPKIFAFSARRLVLLLPCHQKCQCLGIQEIVPPDACKDIHNPRSVNLNLKDQSHSHTRFMVQRSSLHLAKMHWSCWSKSWTWCWLWLGKRQDSVEWKIMTMPLKIDHGEP